MMRRSIYLVVTDALLGMFCKHMIGHDVLYAPGDATAVAEYPRQT